MNKERYNQIIDEVYGNALLKYAFDWLPYTPPGGYLETREMFIKKIKVGDEFSERFGLKIEERELSEKERIKLAGYEDVGGIGQNIIRETVDMDNTIPRRAITVTYNNEKIEVYE